MTMVIMMTITPMTMVMIHNSQSLGMVCLQSKLCCNRKTKRECRMIEAESGWRRAVGVGGGVGGGVKQNFIRDKLKIQ